MELTARLRALIRRGSQGPPGRAHRRLAAAGPGDPGAAWRGEALLDLSAKEFAVLELFLRHPDEVLTRAR